ncbi:selenocysteine-specific translation elongation factor [bacterium 210702-DFI.5.13]|nr:MULTISPECIES: selenocysteine-specific translation elongation factor [Clostridia]MCB6588984.1 selenocysteine-specific translation elongation factor [bacterium 210702-DFI.5.13]MCB5524052.1 selenocysteine-specific translation elongation factor [Blautia schinkii]MCB6330016.1 selenocysteine-specific translation elongation factor [Blautia faecis]MCB6626072.1 selenocysteine-specific translation elongation factor [Blautia sp. 210702-DFI.1.159]MDT4368992.1 selenocysteine-specific translation elongat
MEEKRYRIIGTAGHIDHGKTWLVKALTGTDTDRLAEEKRRGITIENGFAFLKFPDGREAGIIDVPGHERFIKNMLAGAGGIDIAMVVIAVDEGVMPQTREHLAILSLLGIRKGVLVLTKGDLEWKKGLDQEIREFAEGTFLENADVVVTSAVDGRGIEELRRVLWKLCTAGKTTENQNLSRNESDSCTGRMGTKASAFRLPIDRVFSLKGFGTVVTGTLLDGSLGLDYDAMLYPRAERIKIRGIQVHGQEVSEAVPGQRVAVNLPGIGKEQISRGEILATAGSMEGTMIADVRLQLLKSGQRSLKSGTRVHLYHGAAELVCKIILFDREVLKPGEEAVVQLRMEQVTAMKAGDHFVIRFYSPVETIGGGVVLNPNGVKRKKRQNADAVVHCACTGKERKKAHASGKITEEICGNSVFLQLQELYLKSGFMPPLTDEVKKVFSGERDFSEVFFAMVRDGVLVRFDEKHYMHWEIRQKALDMAYLLYEEKGMIQTGEFRDRLGISRKCAIILLEGFDRERITVMENGGRVLKRNLQQADRSQ